MIGTAPRKHWKKSTTTQGGTTAHYLAAAQAADKQDAEDRREYYLEQANSGGSKKRFLVELTRARMLLANGSRAAALPVLQDLYKRKRRHPQVLELLSRCYREMGEWDQLQDLVPALRKAGVMDDDELGNLQQEIAVNKLRAIEDADKLLAGWKKIPRATRFVAAVVEAFAIAAGSLERPELAEAVIATSLQNLSTRDRGRS